MNNMLTWDKLILKRNKDYKTIEDLQLIVKRCFVRYVVKLDDVRFDTIILYITPNRQVIRKERMMGVLLRETRDLF